MGVLRNIRHESFAQAIASGHSAVKAHEIAGFFPDRANAGRLRHRDDISRRVDEILATRTKAIDKALVSAARSASASTKKWVLRNLRRNAVLAMRAGDRAAANRSIELIGKHLGMFIERKQIEIAYVDDADEYLAKIMALVDAKTVEPRADADRLRARPSPTTAFIDAQVMNGTTTLPPAPISGSCPRRYRASGSPG